MGNSIKLSFLVPVLFFLASNFACQSENIAQVKTSKPNKKLNHSTQMDTTTLQPFNITAFENRIDSEDGFSNYTLADGTTVMEDFIEAPDNIEDFADKTIFNTYSQTISHPNNFTETIFYYPSGRPKRYQKIFSSYLETGLWQDFDEQGHVIKSIDKDKDYQFTLDQVLKFGLNNGVDFHESGSSVDRDFDQKYNKLIYKITWIMVGKDDMKIQRKVYLDGQSGEVLFKEDGPVPTLGLMR